MNTLRDAAQQALEALKDDQDRMVETAEKHWEYKTDLAIAALKAALAEPQPEPVALTFAGLTVRELRIPAGMTVRIDRDALIVEPQRDPNDPILVEPNHDPSHAPYVALAEPTVPSDCADSHQPAAWMVYTEGGTSAYVTDNPNDLVGAYRALPLYTAPPQRQPLTEEQIDDCWYQSGGLSLQFARAIERAHGIGGAT